MARRSVKYAVLRLGDLLFVVRDSDDRDKSFQSSHEKKRYFYEDHSCPVNFLKDLVEIWLVRDDHLEIDPHGLFEFSGMIEDSESDGTFNCNDSGWQNRIYDNLVGLLSDDKIKPFGVD